MTGLSLRILEAALKIYTSKPPQNVSIDEIAREAGVSKGTVFYHFKNKREFERCVFIYSIEKYFSWAYDELERKETEALKRTIKKSLKIAKENPRLMIFWYYVLEKELFSGDTEFAHKLYSQWFGLLSSLLKDMGVEKPEQTAIVLMAMLDGISIYSLFIPDLDIDEIGDLILEFVKGRCKR